MSFVSSGNPRISKTCEQCGRSFRTRNTDKKYCSDTCYDNAKASRAYERKTGHGG